VAGIDLLGSVVFGNDSFRLKDSSVGFMGLMGNRVDRLDYFADRSNVVAINSLEFDGDGIRLSSPGSLVVGRLSDQNPQMPCCKRSCRRFRWPGGQHLPFEGLAIPAGESEGSILLRARLNSWTL
jgi:hypothetical protein